MALFAGGLARMDLAPCSQVEERPLGVALLQAMGFTLWRLGLAPLAISVEERVEVRLLVKETRGRLAALESLLADQEMPEGYQRDLLAAELMLNRVLVKLTVTRDAVAKLRVVASDIQAKHAWAQHHRPAPFGPVRLAVADATRVFCSELDPLGGEASVQLVRVVDYAVSLRPGAYVCWSRAGDARCELLVDGTSARIE